MTVTSLVAAPEPQLTRTEVAGLVALAARTVPPLWPLESAIAVNPLAGFEHLPFAEAVTQGARRFGARETLPLAQWRQLLAAGRIERAALADAAADALGDSAREPIAPGVSAHDLLMARLLDLPVAASALVPAVPTPDIAFLAKWCAAFFDQGSAASPMPHRALGLYRAVLALAAHDAEFHALTGDTGAALLLSVPRDPLDAIAEGLAALGVAPGAGRERLAAHVARMPGWAGHIRWRTENADRDYAAGAPADMADLLALWLLLDRAGAVSAPVSAPEPVDVSEALAAHLGFAPVTLAPAGRALLASIARMDGSALGAIFMAAAERGYRDSLVPRLAAAARGIAPAATPDAQLLFCIDVRSEPFRRALEAEGAYETLGYAGFFGLPVALHKHGEARRRRFLPVLLAPQHDVAEAPRPGHEAQAAAFAGAQARDRHVGALFDTAKLGTATAYAAAEATGPLAGVLMAARTLAPRLVDRIGAALKPDRAATLAPSLDVPVHGHRAPFSLEEKIGYATALYRLTGLSPRTARLVVLLGHGGCAVNNPYAAALDCGACGGHAGGANARMIAAMLNDPAVREALVARGVAWPEDTIFVAGEHDTTTDRVTLFDRDDVPASHQAELATLAAALDRAGDANRARRATLLGRSADDLLTGALHWGEVRPEWGLAGNAAFIVGPRALTRTLDLEGRCFLHSYDWKGDGDGTALTTILTAPMVVAQWINGQYLFSTLDNERYGAGDKVTQNVIGGIGVVQGNGGDLKVGLPRQSLFTDDGTPYHVPQRLLTIVLAPYERVAAVVAANDILQRLFGNGWVSLMVIDPVTGQARAWPSEPEAAPAATHIPTPILAEALP
jgi:hypothetical protein